MSEPVLRIEFKTADGKPAVNPIEIKLPEGLSPKLGRMVVLELVDKRIKDNLDAALAAIGIK